MVSIRSPFMYHPGQAKAQPWLTLDIPNENRTRGVPAVSIPLTTSKEVVS